MNSEFKRWHSWRRNCPRNHHRAVHVVHVAFQGRRVLTLLSFQERPHQPSGKLSELREAPDAAGETWLLLQELENKPSPGRPRAPAAEHLPHRLSAHSSHTLPQLPLPVQGCPAALWVEGSSSSSLMKVWSPELGCFKRSPGFWTAARFVSIKSRADLQSSREKCLKPERRSSTKFTRWIHDGDKQACSSAAKTIPAN